MNDGFASWPPAGDGYLPGHVASVFSFVFHESFTSRLSFSSLLHLSKFLLRFPLSHLPSSHISVPPCPDHIDQDTKKDIPRSARNNGELLSRTRRFLPLGEDRRALRLWRGGLHRSAPARRRWTPVQRQKLRPRRVDWASFPKRQRPLHAICNPDYFPPLSKRWNHNLHHSGKDSPSNHQQQASEWGHESLEKFNADSLAEIMAEISKEQPVPIGIKLRQPGHRAHELWFGGRHHVPLFQGRPRH